MSTLSQLASANEDMRAMALEACEAAEALARVANGSRERVVPAPTAYALLGELRVLLWHLDEVTSYLPTGVAASLADPRFDVYDRDYRGEDRDPAAQARLAATALSEASSALQQAASAIEAAQTALNGQGYRAPSGNSCTASE